MTRTIFVTTQPLISRASGQCLEQKTAKIVRNADLSSLSA